MVNAKHVLGMMMMVANKVRHNFGDAFKHQILFLKKSPVHTKLIGVCYAYASKERKGWTLVPLSLANMKKLAVPNRLALILKRYSLWHKERYPIKRF